MPETKQTKEQMLKRRDEINDELSRVNRDLQVELDQDSEEQAIQVEQSEVSVTMESNLRKELADIEDRLLDFDE